MEKTWLVVDIGNSNVVVGLYRADRWEHVWRFLTQMESDAPLYYEMGLRERFLESGIHYSEVQGTVLSSVVPPLTGIWENLLQELIGQSPTVLGPAVYAQLELFIERPTEIRADLVANAYAAFQRRQDTIIVDFGTALTFTTVRGDGTILGVSIAPGLQTAIRALFQKTAQLPEVPLALPESAVGKDTVHAIQSGVLIGYVGLVKHMVATIRQELGGHYAVVATGGLSSILHPLEGLFQEINPQLTLEGLRLIGEKVAAT